MSLRFLTNRLPKTAMAWRSTTISRSRQMAMNKATPLSSNLWNLLSIRTFASKKHKNLLKHAKGYRGRSKNCFRIAIRRVEKAWQYAYRDRRRKKREWRRLWIMRLQAGVRQYDWRYSQFIPALKKANIELNRKVLAEMAANEPFAFKSVVDVVEHVNATKQDVVEEK